MATARTFQDMLNEYLPNDVFKDEVIKRDWYLENMQKDNNWKGGDIIVPFKGASASSVKFGGLTDENDISEHKFVRGKISGYKEVWGTMVFNETDIMQHDGRVNEQSFIRILPDQIEEFVNDFRQKVSIAMLTGPHFSKVVSVAAAATGVLEVTKIDRFEIGQKVLMSNGALVPNVAGDADFYVIAIDVNASTITLSATRGGAFVDLTAVTNPPAATYGLYHDGIVTVADPAPANTFMTVRQALLPALLGGSDTIHGQTKLAYPALQAIQVPGAGITPANIIDKLFEAWNTAKIKAKNANPSKCVVSYKWFGAAMAAIENSGGTSLNRVTTKGPAITKYDWTEISITGVKGSFTLVGVQEMDDDVIYFLDMTAMTFRTNGYIMKKKSPEGLEYYRKRASDGYKLICDICLFGEHEFRKPATCLVIHSIP